jgi:hypothetical protein
MCLSRWSGLTNLDSGRFDCRFGTPSYLFQSAPAELPQAQKGRDAQTSIRLSTCQILRATSAERFTNLRLKSN